MHELRKYGNWLMRKKVVIKSTLYHRIQLEQASYNMCKIDFKRNGMQKKEKRGDP